ncbi:PilZ domain-containing protein [Novosphingobium sp. ZN18A2]|uniref:PilZ domain-containing protein n=1 Tax=Novosphingobium sp. ZN18A2 TaxID=3079861 RepID=UPI0030CDBC5D
MATTRKRSRKRARVLLHGRLDGLSGPQDVRVRDISREGALVEVSTRPHVGEIVELTFGDTRVTGHAAWRDGSWVGMTFAEPLDGTTFVDATGNKLRVTAPRSYRHDRIADGDEEAEAPLPKVRLGDRLN